MNYQFFLDINLFNISGSNESSEALSPIINESTRSGAEQSVVETETGTAPAQPSDVPQEGMSPVFMIGIWAVVLVGFYFITVFPQRKRDKKIKEMQEAIKPGDEVVTSSGF